MAIWGMVLFFAVTVASYRSDLDSLETFYEDANEIDNEVINTRTNTQPLPSIYPVGAPRSCRSWCSCSGQTRSSYCCPTGIPNDSMFQDGGRVVCSGSYCDTRGPIVMRPPGDFCASRICRVLVNSAPTTTWGVNQPLGNTCKSHADCGEDVCCSHICTSMEACIATRRSQGSRVPYGHNSQCTSDVDCDSLGSQYICCDRQCKTRSNCSPPAVFTDTAFY